MNRFAQGILLVAVLAAAGLGFGYLYSLRISKGDVYPPYSSLRADPLGTRALHDGLEDLEGMRVERRFRPLEGLPASPARTIILAGMTSGDWAGITSRQFAALDTAVRGGCRLVLALKADFAAPRNEKDYGDEDDEDAAKPDAPKPGKPKADAGTDAAKPPGVHRNPDVADTGDAEPIVDLKRLWGIELKSLGRLDYGKGATLEHGAPADLPPKVRWESDNYFGVEKGAPWTVLYRALGKPVILESSYGRGSIVVLGDAYLLSNEGLLNDRSAHLLSWLIGPNTRVDFDESHLGVIENVGVAALARRYGLSYAAATLLVLAALFIWRQSALFVPPPADATGAALDCSHTAALEALLLRSVPPAELMGACTSEWRATAPPAELPRLEAALSPGQKAADAYNAAVRALRRK